MTETIKDIKSNAKQDNETFETILKKAEELHHKKNLQYNSAWRCGGVSALNDQLLRKINRYLSIQQGALKGESLFDTLMDLGIYCFLLVQLLEEQNQDEFEFCPKCCKMM